MKKTTSAIRSAELYEQARGDAVPVAVVSQNPADMVRAAALPVVVFALVTALAELLGAANLGTAATFGQIAFIVAAGVVIVRD